jgi:hypothetical protein
MNILFLETGVTMAIIPILTLIEYKPDLVVGCILFGQDPNKEVPLWFVGAKSPDELLDCVLNDKRVLEKLDIFLILKEPNTFLQLNVLAAIHCCNFNFSGTGRNGGLKILEKLKKQNIRTSFAEVKLPEQKGNMSIPEWEQRIKETFEYAFNGVASRWLPECWGLKPEY